MLPPPLPPRLPLGYVQFDLPPAAAEQVTALGRLLPDTGMAPAGREAEPHVTVLWGLVDTPDVVARVRAAAAGFGPVRVTLLDVRRFTGPRVDVVHVRVRAPGFVALHRRLGLAVPHIDSVWPYSPHATLAHRLPAYRDDDAYHLLPRLDLPVLAEVLTLVTPDGGRHPVPLGRRSAPCPRPPHTPTTVSASSDSSPRSSASTAS